MPMLRSNLRRRTGPQKVCSDKCMCRGQGETIALVLRRLASAVALGRARYRQIADGDALAFVAFSRSSTFGATSSERRTGPAKLFRGPRRSGRRARSDGRGRQSFFEVLDGQGDELGATDGAGKANEQQAQMVESLIPAAALERRPTCTTCL